MRRSLREIEQANLNLADAVALLLGVQLTPGAGFPDREKKMIGARIRQLVQKDDHNDDGI